MYIGDDEILGDDDDGDNEMAGDQMLAAELGDDLDQILGADRGSRRSLARKIALARAAGGGVLARKRMSQLQEQVLPFPATAVASATTATILAFPQRTFRTERFLVSSTIAEFFDILDLRIGRDSMMVANGAAPAQGFAEVGVGVRLRGFTANLGNTVALDVTNVDPALLSRTFRAMIIGTAAF